jgi:DNA-directed RNA polymerase subunit RPC12/RpoP
MFAKHGPEEFVKFNFISVDSSGVQTTVIMKCDDIPVATLDLRKAEIVYLSGFDGRMPISVVQEQGEKTSSKGNNMEQYQERVVEEKRELGARNKKLTSFLMSEKFYTLSKADQRLLNRQHMIMCQYEDVLEERIEAFPKEKKLKNFEAFNTEGREKYYTFMHKSNEPRPNGIECPNCKHELVDSSPRYTMSSIPPQKYVHCPQCGYKGYRVA